MVSTGTEGNEAALENWLLLWLGSGPEATVQAAAWGAALRKRGLRAESFQDFSVLVRTMASGRVGAVILAEEAGEEENFPALVSCLAGQPAWSDLPVIVTAGDRTEKVEGRLQAWAATAQGGNVTWLHPPFGESSLFHVAEVALRARRRQYDHRNLMIERGFDNLLEQRVAERTAEVEERANRLCLLAAELTVAEERERRRLAELLHDHLQQLLVAAKMQVGMLRQRPNQESASYDLAQVDSLLGRSIEASRSLTVELSPPVLYDGGLASSLHWLARRMQEDHGFWVSVEAGEEGIPEAESVRVFLFQAVRELIFNSLKYAGVEGASVKLLRSATEVVAIVEDSGIGFEWGKETVSTVGSGFGLFSIGERVKLLGGSMTIKTKPGEGSFICVRVPLAQSDISPGQAIELPLAGIDEGGMMGVTPAGRSGRIRILLADDHKILREGLAGLLREQEDFELVGEASDGQRALEMAREVKPDVIVMDVSMPRVSGVEATRRILAELPRIKVIGLSMHAKEDMAAAMFEAGAADYATKGAPFEVLTEAIRKAAAGGMS
jgi:signal transduction histidine kinase/ActR/RegA family two-component response regulator